MKLYKFLSLLLAVLFLSSAPARTELLDRVVAVVNDEAITQSELDILLRPIYEHYKEQFRGQELMIKLDEARRKLLTQLIEDRIVLQEAESRGLEADPSEVDSRVAEFRERFESQEAMETELARQGMTLHDVEERFRKHALVKRLHDIEVRSRILVSPQEIEDFYRTHPEEFSEEERVRVRSITVKKGEEARAKGIMDEEAMARVKEIQKKLRDGFDFPTLAKQYSEDIQAEEGGLSDWIRKGEMIEVIDGIIFSLSKGDVSEVVETPMGYHLFRVEDRQQGKKLSLEDARDAIYSHVFQMKAEERFDEWMQELKKNSYISIR